MKKRMEIEIHACEFKKIYFTAHIFLKNCDRVRKAN